MNSPFFEIARVLVRLDHVASVIVNANQGVMCPAEEFRLADCIADCVWLAIPEPPEWQGVID